MQPPPRSQKSPVIFTSLLMRAAGGRDLCNRVARESREAPSVFKCVQGGGMKSERGERRWSSSGSLKKEDHLWEMARGMRREN